MHIYSWYCLSFLSLQKHLQAIYALLPTLSTFLLPKNNRNKRHVWWYFVCSNKRIFGGHFKCTSLSAYPFWNVYGWHKNYLIKSMKLFTQYNIHIELSSVAACDLATRIDRKCWNIVFIVFVDYSNKCISHKTTYWSIEVIKISSQVATLFVFSSCP